MTCEEYYGNEYKRLKDTEAQLLNLITIYAATKREKEGVKPIVYYCSRIKTPESMQKKLTRKGYDQTLDAALDKIYDAVGVRAVCAFADDVYRLVKWLKNQPSILIDTEKDYYAYPKPNGYRSYHILLRISGGKAAGCHAELQIRTIATDFWATLEHQLKYKKDIPDEKLIRSELKHCADDIASVDMSMQTIRDILRENTKSQN